MVFAGVFISNSTSPLGFQGGNIAVNDLEEAAALITTAAPADVTSTVGGTLSLGGNSYGNYSYSVWSGGTYSSFTNWINSTNDEHAFVSIKGNATLNAGTLQGLRKTTVCIYVDGNLTLSGANIQTTGCIQASAGLYTTNPASWPLSASTNVTASCGSGGAGQGGGSGGAGGRFSAGAGGAGGPTAGSAGIINGAAYGGPGGRSVSGGFSGYMIGGGAGHPGGPGWNSGINGYANSGGTGLGGTLVVIATGNITMSAGQLISAGFNGGNAGHYSGVQANGGGGSGGGRIYYKAGGTASGIASNVTGGSGGHTYRNGSYSTGGSPGAAGGISAFT